MSVCEIIWKKKVNDERIERRFTICKGQNIFSKQSKHYFLLGLAGKKKYQEYYLSSMNEVPMAKYLIEK